jgi:acetyltransferase-like isoleucine patch superfamily enzyme
MPNYRSKTFSLQDVFYDFIHRLLNAHALTVGDNVYIATGCWLNCLAGLTIEDEVMLGPYVVISTCQHRFRNGSVRFGGSVAAPVVIGKGSWLGAHAVVKCGVRIGRGNIIGANACVTHDTPDDVVCGGVPATVIKRNVDTPGRDFDRAEFMAEKG